MYPGFEDEVALLAVGFGSAQTAEALDGHFMSNGYPGLVAEGPSDMARQYSVTVQSTKFGIAADGEVLLRSGYGAAGADMWQARLQALADS